MSIKITLGQLAQAGQAIAKIATWQFKTPDGKKMAVVDQLIAARFTAPLLKELQAYEEARGKLVRQYGVEIPDQPGQFRFSLGNRDVYNAELAKLNDQEVELSINPLSAQVHTQVDTLTPMDWVALGEKLIIWPTEDASLTTG